MASKVLMIIGRDSPGSAVSRDARPSSEALWADGINAKAWDPSTGAAGFAIAAEILQGRNRGRMAPEIWITWIKAPCVVRVISILENAKVMECRRGLRWNSVKGWLRVPFLWI